MPFQIHALPSAQFEPLFSKSDNELAELNAQRMRVDSKPGYPCRVSLVDAEVGETVLLMNFEHQPANSPYKSAHAIFVRENAEQALPDVDVVPDVLTTRLISIRAFDRDDNMLDADVVDGTRLGVSIPRLLVDQDVAYLHLHNAKRGCFAARVTRVS